MKTVESCENNTIEHKPIIKKRKNSLNESVQVVVRCRPMSTKETQNGNKNVVEVYPKRGVIEIKNPKDNHHGEQLKSFTYDAVYDWNSTQQDIYDTTIRPLVTSVLEGFNGCVFAYGQTGTGKTYTMEGTQQSSEHIGIIPKTFGQIWSHINRTKDMEYLVSVSYLEIHLEEIKDLLKRDHTHKLEIREYIGKGVIIPDLHTITCKSAEDMLYVMNMGNKNRTVGCTNMNEHSSRSHAIFCVTIEMCNTADDTFKVGKLNLIDLAGSERQSKTGATAERLKEASKINRALSALGNVISALAENSPHIPYRDSKLTRLLQDSLGGNSKTIMIANISPSSYNYDESLTTLRYAHRAKTIKNRPIKNEDPKDVKLREYQDEIKRLKLLIEQRKQQEKTIIIKKVKKVKKETEASSPSPGASEDINKSTTSINNEENIEVQLKYEREKTDELAKRLQSLESQLIRGGKNILDEMNEKQIQLEQQLNEIAERKKRETEMQQMLELEEETNIEFRSGFSNLQQEAELKSRKLKKLFQRLQNMKQEISDLKLEHNRDCREMEITQESLVKELKLKIMIIDNFVPIDDKQYMLNNARYDDNLDEWILPTQQNNLQNTTNDQVIKITHRPLARPELDRPYSEYALNKMRSFDCPYRFKSENILNLNLDMPQKTTSVYKRPDVSPALRAVLDEAMQVESDLEIDDKDHSQALINNQVNNDLNNSLHHIRIKSGTVGTGSARTQAQMDTIAHNLAMKKDTTQRHNNPTLRKSLSAHGTSSTGGSSNNLKYSNYKKAASLNSHYSSNSSIASTSSNTSTKSKASDHFTNEYQRHHFYHK
ncbi:kinesin-like protein Klp68D [Chrysoperla carnea]|uniref:kinesin-like protein Klp68D n=1 Tax=Chrysoperla carnea TaxID=189513 RepID=UPI001D081C9F|nr:kinesin-like protein Klp68D [Chrysoperla carnea]